MNPRIALLLVTLFVACEADTRPEGPAGDPQVFAPTAVDETVAPAPTIAPESIAAPEAAAEAEAASSEGIGLRLLSVIDEASLGTAFLHAVHSVAGREDGSMIVAHQGDRTLLWLDGDGRLLRAIGERGSAPGEFRSTTPIPPDVLAFPDGVVAWDFTVRRLTIYSPTGEFQRTVTLPETGQLLGLSNDREAVMGGLVRPESQPREYFGVDLESGSVTWRWSGPDARSPSIRFESGSLPDGRPTYTDWGLPIASRPPWPALGETAWSWSIPAKARSTPFLLLGWNLPSRKSRSSVL